MYFRQLKNGTAEYQRRSHGAVMVVNFLVEYGSTKFKEAHSPNQKNR